jgi:guanylate kinase
VGKSVQYGQGGLFVVSGPSGVGKTSLCREILATTPGIVQSIACTTRAARAHERDGREYYFVSRDTFERRIEAGDFLEWAWVHEHLYGTLRQQVEETLRAGTDMLLAIDVQGAAKLRAAHMQAVFVFVLPPTWQTLEARLQQRNSEAPEVQTRRLAVARQELTHYTGYDYVVYNDDLTTAVGTLRAIIEAERHRISRVGPAPLEALLASHDAAAP